MAGHLGDRDTARAHLSDRDPGVRATALGALARTGVLDAAELVATLTDPDPGVRRRACEVAAAAGLDVGAALLERLGDDDDRVVETAAWALGEIDPPDGVVAALSELATAHPEPLVREAAVAALGAVGDPAGLPAILAATGDKPPVRRRAVLALAPFDDPDVDAALQRALADRDWQVRDAAELLLRP